MRKLKFTICIICVLALCCGCWDKRELEDNTFVVLLGIDKAGERDIELTVAFPLTQLEGEEQSGKYSVMSVKAPTVIEGLNMLSVKLAGPISLFSVKTVVISRKLAENDMLRHVFSSWRYEHIRNTTNVLISECGAAEFINARIKDPVIDVLRQEELLLEQVNNSSYYRPVQLLDLVISLKSNGEDSVAMYGGISESGDEEDEEKEENDIEKVVKKGYSPGEIPIKAENPGQICGLAVFRKNKMAGIFNSAEAQTYSMLTRGNTNKILTFPDPLKPDSDIVVSVLPTRGVKIKSYIRDGLPVFDIGVNLHSTLECVQSGVDYKDDENFKLLTEYVKEECLNDMEKLIKKAQKEYNADILKLGDKLAWHFLTIDEWHDFDWPEKYKDAQINVAVDLKIDRAGVMMP